MPKNLLKNNTSRRVDNTEIAFKKFISKKRNVNSAILTAVIKAW